MFRTRSKLVVSLLAGAVALGACDSGSTGPDAGSTSETRVLLSGGASASAALLPAFSIGGASFAAGPVTLGSVKSIDVTLDSVQALPANADETSDESWISLSLTAPTRVDLLALPADAAAGGLELARADLPAGTYGNVRLFVSDASVTFKEAVSVGRSSYPANEKIALEIPSASESGIKTSARFTVADDSAATVRLVFDASASVRNIIATGAGKVLMTPVLGSKQD